MELKLSLCRFILYLWNFLLLLLFVLVLSSLLLLLLSHLARSVKYLSRPWIKFLTLYTLYILDFFSSLFYFFIAAKKKFCSQQKGTQNCFFKFLFIPLLASFAFVFISIVVANNLKWDLEEIKNEIFANKIRDCEILRKLLSRKNAPALFTLHLHLIGVD
jgi:hypothetical protein